jgi:hypothetical protein
MSDKHERLARLRYTVAKRPIHPFQIPGTTIISPGAVTRLWSNKRCGDHRWNRLTGHGVYRKAGTASKRRKHPSATVQSKATSDADRATYEMFSNGNVLPTRELKCDDACSRRSKAALRH